MENKVIQEVLEEIVKIDNEAEELKTQNADYIVNSDKQLKNEIHQTELEIMGEMRSRVKAEFSQKIEETNQLKIDIEETARDYQNKVITYYNRYRQELVEQLFREIFIEVDNGQ